MLTTVFFTARPGVTARGGRRIMPFRTEHVIDCDLVDGVVGYADDGSVPNEWYLCTFSTATMISRA